MKPIPMLIDKKVNLFYHLNKTEILFHILEGGCFSHMCVCAPRVCRALGGQKTSDTHNEIDRSHDNYA